MSSRLIALLLEMGDSEHRLAAGESLFRAGDSVFRMFIVTEGMVSLVRYGETGRRLVLQRAAAGSLLAEASYFGTEYHCDAVACEPSSVIGVSTRKLKAAEERMPDFMRELAAHLARDVQRMRAYAEILALKTVAQKLDAWLLASGERLPAKGMWGGLAAQINVAPEALYRELARRRRCAGRPAGRERFREGC
ncbi:Crp/Fnr family transcriptional regulator [Bosea sp. CS1GBMeth4]|uniref:Crp/Fnr family transcriptional regulator n=1 Tax=Bosea sp. CS1GBMeth4 TaxID=1892849 RepID=UPI001645065B|nr:Crp/Fnr family transcriptional regulator [Bosea sp. CS1GBMeth4]